MNNVRFDEITIWKLICCIPKVEVDLLVVLGEDAEFGDSVVPFALEGRFNLSCDLCRDLVLDDWI